jgi:hypothetical protein
LNSAVARLTFGVPALRHNNLTRPHPLLVPAFMNVADAAPVSSQVPVEDGLQVVKGVVL